MELSGSTQGDERDNAETVQLSMIGFHYPRNGVAEPGEETLNRWAAEIRREIESIPLDQDWS